LPTVEKFVLRVVALLDSFIGPPDHQARSSFFSNRFSSRFSSFPKSTVMANIPSVAKRARQSVKLHARNSAILTAVKSAKKKVRAAVAGGNPTDATEAYRNLSSVLDKAAKRGAIHPNAASRGKSRLKKVVTPKAATPAA
jgi:small subunit ribosomal protein S20